MEQQKSALGMIETWGLPALIAAADAAAKTADVRVTTYEKVDAGIVTIYVLGDVAAVKAAVEAGAAAAERVGKLLSTHVIPRPDASIWSFIQALLQRQEPPGTEGPSIFAASAGGPSFSSPEGGNGSALTADSANLPPVHTELEKLSVQQLRQHARSTPGFPLTGAKISLAGRAELLRLLTEMNE